MGARVSNTKKNKSIHKNQVIVSAGDAVTAKLVQEAGFDGIWVSGFEACCRLGLPDNGSITMEEMLRVTAPIVKAVNIPVWVDTDTGYGNFQRTVDEFENIGAYGVCVEDNVPGKKINSLWGRKIPLLPMKEFGDKINVKRSKIKIMARTEALIRGYGQDEARERIKYYVFRNCDYALPHARKSVDIMRVKRQNTPHAIVPTKFPGLDNNFFFSMGYSLVIWANQTERVKIKSIRDALFSLKTKGCAYDIEARLSATLDDMRGLMPSGT